MAKENADVPMSGAAPEVVLTRRPGLIELVALALYIPSALTSAITVWLVAAITSEVVDRGDPTTVGTVAVALFLAGGIALATPAGQPLVMWMTHQRRPSDAEAARLEPVWIDLCSRLGISTTRFTLRVEDTDELNAFAAGTRSVAVTRDAMALDPDLLEAILAHEIGHHARWHPTIGMFGWYFTAPTRILANALVWLFDLLWRVLAGALGGVAAVGSLWGIAFVGVLFLMFAMFAPLLLVPLLFVILVDALSSIASRRLELRADSFAADRGFGEDLVRGLVAIAWSGVPHQDQHWFESASSSHPSPRSRINRLMARLEKDGVLSEELREVVARTDPGPWAAGERRRARLGSRGRGDWGLARLSPTLRIWVHEMAPQWDSILRRIGPQITVLHHTPEGRSQGAWLVMAGGHSWEEIPFSPPEGLGSHGPRSAMLRQLVMQAYLEERGGGGTIHMRSKEHGDIYRTIQI